MRVLHRGAIWCHGAAAGTSQATTPAAVAAWWVDAVALLTASVCGTGMRAASSAHVSSRGVAAVVA